MPTKDESATLSVVFARERRSFLLLLAIVVLGCSFSRPLHAASIPYP
jgi:hypothetical protein